MRRNESPLIYLNGILSHVLCFRFHTIKILSNFEDDLKKTKKRKKNGEQQELADLKYDRK